MTDILLLTSMLIPVITGLVEVVKMAFNLKINLIPVIALLTGLLTGIIAAPISDLDMVNRLWAGGLAGLASVGLFEVIKQREGQTKGEEF